MTEILKPNPSPAPDRLTVIVSRAEQQVNNPRFSQEFREELKQMKLTESELTELASRFEQSKVVEGIKNDAKAAILDRMKEDRQTLMKTLNPLTWTPENQRTAVMAVGGVAVGALVLRWIGSSTRKAREAAGKTVENVKYAGRMVRNTFMYALGGTVLVLAGFAGIKVWQNWGKLEQMLSSARILNDKMMKAGGEQLAAMQKQLAETQHQIAVMTGLAEEKVAALTSTANKAKEQVAEVVTPAKVAEATEKGAEIVVQKSLGKGLMLLHAKEAAQAGFDVEQSYSETTIEGALNLKPVRSLKITDLVNIAQKSTFEEAKNMITEKVGVNALKEEELKAVYFLALVAKAQQKNIRPPEGVKAEDVQVETLLDQTGDVARLLARTKEKMKNVNLADPADIARRMSEIYSGSENFTEDLASSASMQKQLESIGLKKEDLAKFALFCTKKGATLLTSAEQLSIEEGEKKYVDALILLKKKIAEKDTLNADIRTYLELYAHGQEEFLTPLRQRMDQLTIMDGVQLWMGLEKTRDTEGKLPENLNNSNPLTALTMQMKVLSMIASKDTYQGDKLKAFLTLKAGAAGTAWLLGENTIELPESLKKTLPIIGEIVGNVAQDKLKDIQRQASAVASETDKQYPWLKVLGVGGIGLYFRAKYNKWKGNVLTRQIVHDQNGWGFAAHNNPSILQSIRKRIDPLYQSKINEDMVKTKEMLHRLHQQKGRSLTPEEIKEAIKQFETAGADDITRSASGIDETVTIRPPSAATEPLPTTSPRPADLGTAPRTEPLPTRSGPLPDADIPDLPADATIPFQRTQPVVDDAMRAGNTAEDVTRTASGTTETITPRMPAGPDTLPMRPSVQDLPPVDLGGPAPRLNPSPAPASVPGPDLRIVSEDGTVVDAAGRPAETAAQATETARGAQAAETLADEARWAKIISKYPGKVNVGDVGAFLELAQQEGLIALDKDTLALINESAGAKKIIAGAVESTDIKEITRAMQAAKNARALRIGLNGLGAAGDVFGVYMAYADFQTNGERIESARETGNKELADLYAKANYVYTAEGVQSVAGLVIGGVAIVRAYAGGQSVLTALGASGGLILIPVAAAALGGGYIYRQAESVSADWTRNAKDWQRTLTPGEMLEKLKATGPGQRSYWQGWGKGTFAEQDLRRSFTSREAFEKWEEAGEKTIEDANAQMRYELTKGYLASSTILAPRPQETEAQYRQRFDQFVIDRLEYTTLTTEGMYGYLPSGYQMSNAYAELMGKSRELQKTGQSEKLTWTDYEGKEQSFDLKNFADLPWNAEPGEMGRQAILGKYIYQEKTNRIMQFNIMEKLPTGLNDLQKKRAMEQQLILETTDELMKLDGRISTADFAGLAITGGEQQSKALARYTASRMYLDALNNQATSLLAQAKTAEGITPEFYDAALQNIRSVIGSNDPLDYQRIGTERKYIEQGYVVNNEEANALLSPKAMMQEIEKTADAVKVKAIIREEIEKTPQKNLSKMRKELGELTLLKQEGIEQNGEVYSVQYGNIFNKYLYAKYNGEQWEVSIGGGGAGPWKNPQEVQAVAGTFGFSADTAGRYNNIIRSLAEANAEFQK